MDLAKAARDPWVWGQLVLFLLIGIGAPVLPRHVNLGNADFMLNRVDPRWIRALGTGLLLLGGLLFAWGVRSLGRNLTPGTEPLPDAELVTEGAYHRVRHPIYGGLVLALAGYTLVWSNWTLALLFGFLALKFFQAKATVEENWLVERFPGYRSYMRRVTRQVL
jgi:protein-S-isoprenylcysteine O-methyltransferase Ste14